MKTFILKWNPAISSFKLEEFRRCIPIMKNSLPGAGDSWEDGDECELLDFNWSVWDWQNASPGDRFFMARVGEGKTGLVMAGTFSSPPYRDEDWSGKGRETHYVDLDVEAMADTEQMPFVSTAELAAAVPGFDWTKGHSGEVLGREQAEALEALWTEYVWRNWDEFDFVRGGLAFPPSYFPDSLEPYLRKTLGEKCAVCGYSYREIWGEECELSNPYIRYIPAVPSLRDSPWKHFHCVCPSCMKMPRWKIAGRLGEPPYLADFFPETEEEDGDDGDA